MPKRTKFPISRQLKARIRERFTGEKFSFFEGNTGEAEANCSAAANLPSRSGREKLNKIQRRKKKERTNLQNSA